MPLAGERLAAAVAWAGPGLTPHGKWPRAEGGLALSASVSGYRRAHALERPHACSEGSPGLRDPGSLAALVHSGATSACHRGRLVLARHRVSALAMDGALCARHGRLLGRTEMQARVRICWQPEPRTNQPLVPALPSLLVPVARALPEPVGPRRTALAQHGALRPAQQPPALLPELLPSRVPAVVNAPLPWSPRSVHSPAGAWAPACRAHAERRGRRLGGKHLLMRTLQSLSCDYRKCR